MKLYLTLEKDEDIKIERVIEIGDEYQYDRLAVVVEDMVDSIKISEELK